MLVIRDEQMRALEAARFSAWLLHHLRRFFPERCLELGTAGLVDTVQGTLAQAREHGFKAPADLCRYADIAFALGLQFGNDPSLPWAAELLGAAEISDPTERMDLLTAAAKRQVAALAGQGDER